MEKDNRTKYMEELILKSVYDKGQIAEIIATEQPDFMIRNNNENSFWGVEVTEFYFSESNARLRNIDNYYSEIFDGQRYRHKDDIETLRLQEMTYIPTNKKEKKQIKGIIQELPKPNEYVNMVADVIEKKNIRFNSYNKNLTHINLIILDTESRLFGLKAKDLSGYFVSSAFRETIYTSSFREIFLVTKIEDNRGVFVPLVLLILLGELYAFNALIISDYHSLFPTISDELKLFAQYLKTKSGNNAQIRDEDKDHEVLYRGYGFQILEGNKPNIRDYRDGKIPNDAHSVNQNFEETILDKSFNQKINGFWQNNRFCCELAFDLKGKIPGF